LETPLSRCARIRQAPAAALKEKHTSIDGNDIQSRQKSPLQSNDAIRTGWMVNIAREVPRHNGGMLGLDDKLSFNDERPNGAI
jgi:hypothetical protein